MLSSKVAPSKVCIRHGQMLLAKPLVPSRFVVVRYRDDEQPSATDKVQNKVKEAVDAAQFQLDKIGKQAGTNFEPVAKEGQNLADAGQVSFNAQVKANPAVSAFTRRREVFAGRLAMVGFWAACFWECYLPFRPNILGQLTAFSDNILNYHISEGTWLAIVGALVAYNGLSAFSPASPTLSNENQDDVKKRPLNPNNIVGAGGSDEPVPNTPGQLLGIRGWGFSKANELFVGRVAMLGFAFAILGQLWLGGLQGPGPLAQVAYWLGQVGQGQTPADGYYSFVSNVFFPGFVIFAFAVSYLRGQFGTTTGEEDIY